MLSIFILLVCFRIFYYLLNYFTQRELEESRLVLWDSSVVSNQSEVDERRLVLWDSAIEMDDSNMSDSMDCNGDNADRNNLIVNYLPENTTQDDFQKMFEGFGDIESCKLIRHKSLGHSLGYGFVKYKAHEDAEAAINALNGLMMQNKKLKVSFARPANEPIKTANLYISGLKNTITEPELVALFSPFGKVLTVKVMNNDNDPHKTSAIGFVRFEQYAHAQEAMEALNGKTPPVNPSAIHVSFAKHTKDATGLAAPAAKAAGYQTPYSNNFPNSRFGNFGKTPSMMGKNLRFDPMGRGAGGRGAMGDGLYGIQDPYSAEAIASGHVLFVFNLAPEVEELHLWRLFGPFGAIRSVNIVMDKTTNRSKGFAFINMSSYPEAENAILHLHQTTLEGKVIQVSFKKPKQKY